MPHPQPHRILRRIGHLLAIVGLVGCTLGTGASQPKQASAAALFAPGEVIALRGERLFAVSGFGDAVAYPAGWASLGRLVWTQGGNAGEAAPVRLFSRVPGGGAEVELWAPPGVAAAVGDRFELFAGCDKAAETCRDKFGNLAGFRGFPHMPGEDWVTAYPGAEESHDGGSLFR